MDHTARIPVAVGGGPGEKPWRRRIRRIAALPVLTAVALVTASVLVD